MTIQHCHAWRGAEVRWNRPTVLCWMSGLVIGLIFFFCASNAWAATKVFTTQDDWLTGTYTNTNSDEPPIGHVKLNESILSPFNHIWVSLAGRASVVRINTDASDPDGVISLAESAAGAGAVLGEYLTRPEGLAGNPSRTTVDTNGDVWLGNRDEAGAVPNLGNLGSAVKVSASPNAEHIFGAVEWHNFRSTRLVQCRGCRQFWGDIDGG